MATSNHTKLLKLMDLPDEILLLILEAFVKKHDLKLCTWSRLGLHSTQIHFGEQKAWRLLRSTCQKFDEILLTLTHNAFTGVLDLSNYNQNLGDFEAYLTDLESRGILPDITKRITTIIIQDRHDYDRMQPYQEILLSPYRSCEIIIHISVSTFSAHNLDLRSSNSLIENNGNRYHGFRSVLKRLLSSRWQQAIDSDEKINLTVHLWRFIESPMQETTPRVAQQHAIIEIKKMNDLRLRRFEVVEFTKLNYRNCKRCSIDSYFVPGRLHPLFEGKAMKHFRANVIEENSESHLMIYQNNRSSIEDEGGYLDNDSDEDSTQYNTSRDS